MRIYAGIFLAIGLIGLTGCNEIVKTDEQTSSIDVVGEPADPAPDSMRPADILGSAVPLPDDGTSISDIKAGRETDDTMRDLPPQSAESESPPDVAGGLGLAKPVSLKTNKSENPSTRQTKP